eukprot:COSAG01_NODE_50551_length_362_cov_1.030418_1_plen_30_part_10
MAGKRRRLKPGPIKRRKQTHRQHPVDIKRQ